MSPKEENNTDNQDIMDSPHGDNNEEIDVDNQDGSKEEDESEEEEEGYNSEDMEGYSNAMEQYVEAQKDFAEEFLQTVNDYIGEQSEEAQVEIYTDLMGMYDDDNQFRYDAITSPYFGEEIFKKVIALNWKCIEFYGNATNLFDFHEVYIDLCEKHGDDEVTTFLEESERWNQCFSEMMERVNSGRSRLVVRN